LFNCSCAGGVINLGFTICGTSFDPLVVVVETVGDYSSGNRIIYGQNFELFSVRAGIRHGYHCGQHNFETIRR
jgi:hypothetical protein